MVDHDQPPTRHERRRLRLNASMPRPPSDQMLTAARAYLYANICQVAILSVSETDASLRARPGVEVQTPGLQTAEMPLEAARATTNPLEDGRHR